MQAAQPPQTLYQGVEKCSSGYKLLESMGWKEGEGLGAQKQGIITHVRVKKKDGALGVGAAEQASRLRDWTTGMFSYETILTSLKEVKAVRPELDDTGSDEDVVEACNAPSAAGEAAAAVVTSSKTAKKAAKKASRVSAAAALPAAPEVAVTLPAAKGKKRKLAVVELSCDAAKVVVTAAAAAAAASTNASSAAPTKLATHVGRYQKRERAKKVGNYSSTDLAAILGNAAAVTGGVAFVPGPAPVFAAIEDSDDGTSDEDEEAAATSSQHGLQSDGRDTASEHVSQQDAERAAAAAAATTSAPQPPAWWSSLFVRSGRMGSMRKETRASKKAAPADGQRAAIQVTGFREADQENLALQAHDRAAVGRQGLGRSDMPKKVAGARWCGTKTKLTTDGDDSDQEEQEGDGGEGEGGKEEQADDDDDEAEGIVVLAAKTTVGNSFDAAVAAAAAAGPAVQDGPGGQGGGTSRAAADATAGAVSKTRPGLGIKWAKLARKVLADTPQRRLKITKLQKRLLEAAAATLADDADGVLVLASVADAMMKRLRRCARLQVCDRFVGLVAQSDE